MMKRKPNTFQAVKQKFIAIWWLFAAFVILPYVFYWMFREAILLMVGSG